MKRPIVVILLGYIIGIIVGLYLNTSIVPIYIPAIIIYILTINSRKKQNNKLKLLSIKRYIRYIKIFLNSNVIIIIIISSIISNTIILVQNKTYSKIYKELSQTENINETGIVISKKEEKQYYNKYKLQVEYNNKKINFYIMTNKEIELNYGDKIQFTGTYSQPEEERNYKGFNYKEYLKQIKVYGTIKIEKLIKIGENKGNKLYLVANKLTDRLEENTYKILDKETAAMFLGLMIGTKEGISEEIEENFKNASLSHVLAVSGMHITYIILGLNILLKNTLGKRITNILIIPILIIYMLISGFTPSITRAGIMGILVVISKLIHRKNDIFTSIAASLLIILISNPYLIQNLGLQLSYAGTLGIILFYKKTLNILTNIHIKNRTYKFKIKPKINKYVDKLKDISALSIAVQIVIFPIIIVQFNTFTPYFLIANILLSIIIAPIVILGFVFMIVVLINPSIADILSKLIEISIKLIQSISEIGKLPFSKIYISTPKLFWVLIYYLIIITIFVVYEIYSSKKPNMTQMRARNLIALIKIKARTNHNKIKRILILASIILTIINFIPKNLKIHFIDVGQGDSTLIITPHNKTILIDGGGSSNSDYDVGKNTLLPYILDRGIKKIDIIIISHFDDDHVGGLFYILKEIKVEKVIIGKQFENCENYEKFMEIVKEKNIKVIEVKSGNRIKIEKNLYIDILWPTDKEITENVLNNNALVFKLNYKDFSILFTGDIEEVAEKKILKLYSKSEKILKADILKVAHHGSKTSSTEEFLDLVKPKIALIGVGKNNKFGHPNEEILERLEDLNCKIFRTDLNGEISIVIKFNGVYKIKTRKSD